MSALLSGWAVEQVEEEHLTWVEMLLQPTARYYACCGVLAFALISTFWRFSLHFIFNLEMFKKFHFKISCSVWMIFLFHGKA